MIGNALLGATLEQMGAFWRESRAGGAALPDGPAQSDSSGIPLSFSRCCELRGEASARCVKKYLRLTDEYLDEALRCVSGQG